MFKPIFAIYGASGLGKCVLPIALEQLSMQGIDTERLVFIDDNPQVSKIYGQSVLSYKAFLDFEASERFIVISISDSVIREKIACQCKLNSVKFWTLSATNSVLMNDVQIDEGAILRHFTTLGPNVNIGKHFILGMHSYVSHDCEVGDFVTLAPGVKCNGNVNIESHVYIGSGSIIKQGKLGKPLVIGKGAIIGMGAVVTKDVPAGITVVGNPAKPQGKL